MQVDGTTLRSALHTSATEQPTMHSRRTSPQASPAETPSFTTMHCDTHEELEEEVIEDVISEVRFAEVTLSEAKRRHQVHPREVKQAERALVLKQQNLDLVLKATKGINLYEYSDICAAAFERDKHKSSKPREEGGGAPPSHGRYHRIGKILVYPKIKLGQGAYGVVYQGKFGGRDVAVKRVIAATNIDREVELHLKCDAHENVCRYLWKEKDPMGDTYLVLELCLGTLAHYVEGKISVKRLQRDLMKDATKGLHHLHKLGIVHRDIKPSNILISRPQYGTAKAVIADFGFSKELNKDCQSFSVSEGCKGTHGWMAPEILIGPVGGTFRATTGIDIYALGCVFYYTLTDGQLPFTGRDDKETMANIKEGVKDLTALIGKSSIGWPFMLTDSGIQRMTSGFVHLPSNCSTDSFTALSLITSMISCDARKRPPTEAVLQHPYFWEENKKLSYIEVVSDYLTTSDKRSRSYKSHMCQKIDDCKIDILGSEDADWAHIIRRYHPNLEPVMSYLEKPPRHVKVRYNFKSMVALLRAIRNISHHLASFPRKVRDAFRGSSPKTLVSELFIAIFPRLLVFTWLVMLEEEEPGLKEYHHEWWRERAFYLHRSLSYGGGMCPWPDSGIRLRPVYEVSLDISKPFRYTQEEPESWCFSGPPLFQPPLSSSLFPLTGSLSLESGAEWTFADEYEEDCR